MVGLLLLAACAEPTLASRDGPRELPGSIAQWEQGASARARATTIRIDAGDEAALVEVKGGLDAADPAARLDAAAALGLVRTHVGFAQLARTVAPKPDGMHYVEFCTDLAPKVLARVAAAEGRSKGEVLLAMAAAAPDLEEHVWFLLRSDRAILDELLARAEKDRGSGGAPAIARLFDRIDGERAMLRPDDYATGIARVNALEANGDREGLLRFLRDPKQARLQRLYAGGRLVRLGEPEGLAVFEEPASAALAEAHLVREELEALERETSGPLRERVRAALPAYRDALHPAVKAGIVPPP